MVTHFLNNLRARNAELYFFGLACFFAGAFFVVLSFMTDITVVGVNAWYKPIKFCLSIGIMSVTMGWLMYELKSPRFVKSVSWVIVLTMTFEIVYIAIQAGRGEISHFNQTNDLYRFLYSLMAFCATLTTLAVMTVSVLFFTKRFKNLSPSYLWGIRLGTLIFTIFSFTGFVMGSKLTHTIGGPDGEIGLPFVGWSLKYGDLRISHFIGMHALQVLPFLGFCVTKNVWGIIAISFLYFCLAVFTLIVALMGKPLIGL